MKKILAIALVLILALSLLTACGDNGGGNSDGGNGTNSPTGEAKDVIMPSKIITLEDAERILGIDMRVFEELDKKQTGTYDGDNSYKTCYTQPKYH